MRIGTLALLCAGLLCTATAHAADPPSGCKSTVSGDLRLHTLESQVATPLALGRTINLNPLAIILWLLIWGWLWGILGLLLAVPMLVCFKIVCSRVESLHHWAVLLEK